MPKMKYWPLRYGVAVAAVAAGIAFLLIPQIGKGLGSILFLAVLISAWYGGVGPGLLATALITVVAIRGVARFEPSFAPWRVASIVLFVGGGVLITLLVEALHAARRRVEAAHQELVRRMEQLAEADVRKDEFLAMLAHELRNPMAAISNAAQLAALCGAQDQIGWSMEVIDRQVKHLARLIDDLLDVARVTQGKIRLRKEHVDIALVLHSAIESARPLIESREHKLTIAIPPQALPAEGDPLRLEQIVTNLLTNAGKYTPNGGEILLSAGREGESIVIKVRDTGVGISPEQISKMFELFAQGDRSLARSEGGLGIGLTLARSLAEMHGGRLTATSDGLGKGSEFVVHLPAAVPSGAGPKCAGQPGDAGRSGGMRVLVIDDHVDTTQGLSRLLKLLNHEVWTAGDGPTGLEAARAHRPDVLLLDIGLPGMDGYQVAEQLRREDFGKDMLLIALTGYGREEDHQRALSAGFDHFVTKPVDYAALQAIMVVADPASR